MKQEALEMMKILTENGRYVFPFYLLYYSPHLIVDRVEGAMWRDGENFRVLIDTVWCDEEAIKTEDEEGRKYSDWVYICQRISYDNNLNLMTPPIDYNKLDPLI